MAPAFPQLKLGANNISKAAEAAWTCSAATRPFLRASPRPFLAQPRHVLGHALLDLAEAYPSLDILPRPEGGAIVPVIMEAVPDQDSHDYKER